MKTQMQRCIAVGAILIGMTVFGQAAQATGVQCESASGAIEKAICTDPALLKLDHYLGDLYDAAFAKDPSVKDRQMQWLQNNLSQCKDKKCLVLAYKDQIEALDGNWEQIKQEVLAADGNEAQPATQPQNQVESAPSREELAKRQQEIDSRRIAEERHQREQQEKRESNKRILIIAVVLVLAGLGWHFFVRNRCPHCKSTKYRRMTTEEVDRWRGTKQVTERMASGKNKTRNVQTTFVVMRFGYQCKACQGEWEKEREEEKGKGSWLGRLLTGY